MSGEECRAYVHGILEQVDLLRVSDVPPIYKMAVREELVQVKHPALDSIDSHSALASFQEAMNPRTVR